MSRDRSKKSFTWVDRAILLLVAAIFLLSLGYWRVQKNAAKAEVWVNYRISIAFSPSEYSADVQQLVPIGAMVLNENGTVEMGRVEAVSVRPVWRAVLQNREVRFVKEHDRGELIVSVGAWATQKEGDGFRVGDIRIGAGGVGSFRIGKLTVQNAAILAIEGREDA